MVNLTFFGGVHEIGGNKILLEDQNTRVLLDWGLSFSQMNDYYDEFLKQFPPAYEKQTVRWDPFKQISSGGSP